MNGLPYYKAYPRDFIEGTVGMPFDLKAAYRLILDLIYMQGGTLPDDARYIAGLLGCSVRKWSSFRETLISAGKLSLDDQGFFNADICRRWAAFDRMNAARPSIPAETKKSVMSEGRCAYCGTVSGPFEIDHIVPWSRGGAHERDNLALACKPCNRRKQNRTPQEMGWVQ